MRLDLAHKVVIARLVSQGALDLARQLLAWPWIVGTLDVTLLRRCLRSAVAEVDAVRAGELERNPALGAADLFQRWTGQATGGRPREGGRAALRALCAWLQTGGSAGASRALEGARLAADVADACESGPRGAAELAEAQAALEEAQAALVEAWADLERRAGELERRGLDLDRRRVALAAEAAERRRLLIELDSTPGKDGG